MHRAYAKINLGLFVLRKRADGYHDIETVFHRIDLYDDISLSLSTEVSVASTDPAAPSDERNICFKAVRLLQQHYGTTRGVNIAITKRIPVGAGLGGGSSDAAVVLRQLPRLWGVQYDEAAARRMAVELGADVGYFLGRGSARGTGRGENLTYFPLKIPWAILLCNPGIHISTAWAYAQVSAGGSPPTGDLRTLLAEGIANPALLREHLRNDFEAAVFAAHPNISRLRGTMLDSGALFASMSGSGSSVYGFFESGGQAEELAARYRATGYTAFVTPPFFDPT